ncbi:MAG: hypothetical protein ABI651_19920 [Verrucomicrobiota bacterium]
MKTNLLLIAAVIAVATLTSVANADDAYLSPKATQLKESLRTVAGTTPGLLDSSVKPGSPKGIAFAESLRKVPGTTEDLLVRYTGAFSPRALANNPSLGQQFQVAPLK